MTVYVKNNPWQIPAKRHIPMTPVSSRSFCGVELVTDSEYRRIAPMYARGIDCDSLPLCRRCQKVSTP